jgi:hypothetical protein
MLTRPVLSGILIGVARTPLPQNNRPWAGSIDKVAARLGGLL